MPKETKSKSCRFNVKEAKQIYETAIETRKREEEERIEDLIESTYKAMRSDFKARNKVSIVEDLTSEDLAILEKEMTKEGFKCEVSTEKKHPYSCGQTLTISIE
jgi:hypothetical protein